MGALKINVSSVDGQSWPLVLHQTLNQKSTGWGPGIKFLNASDSSGKWAGIGGMSGSEYANNNDLVFYTSAEARFRMNNNTFYPIGDAIYNLGGPTVRWANVYGVNFHGKADTVNTVEISSINNFNNFVEICRGKFHIAMLYGNKQLPEFTNAGTSVSGWMTGLICCQSDGAFSAFYHSHQSDKLYFASDSNGTNFTRHHQIAYLDQVLPLSGGTMSGALNFANATWNKLGDDVQFGDRNKPGGFFIQGLNGTTNLTFTQHGGAAEGSISFDGSNFNISNYIVGTISNAQKDGDGNTISSTYVPYIKYCDNGLNFNTVVNSGFYRISANNTNCPDGADWGQLLVVHGGGDTITQIYGNYSSGDLFTRSGNPSDVGGSGSWSGWRKLLDSSNYTSYTVTKTGTGASGSWAINIYGTAAAIARGGDLNYPMMFYWHGKSGQPSWLWGGSDGTNMYVYNPSEFSVNYANSAGRLTSTVAMSGTPGTDNGKWVKICQETLGGWRNARLVLAISSRYQGTGIFSLTLDVNSSGLAPLSGSLNYNGSCPYGIGDFKAYYNESTGNFTMWMKYVNYSQANVTVLESYQWYSSIQNYGIWDTIPSDVGYEIGIKVNAGDTCHNFGANQPNGSARVGTLYYQTIG